MSENLCLPKLNNKNNLNYKEWRTFIAVSVSMHQVTAIVRTALCPWLYKETNHITRTSV